MKEHELMSYKFLARQPIFDKKRKIFAYELLYRAGDKYNFNVEAELDGDQASKAVLNNAITVIGLNNITGNKRAFINFTYNLLQDSVLLSNLNPKDIVVEILEDVVIDESILLLLKRLKSKGYVIALDDYEDDRYEYYSKIYKYIDIIKVDFKLNSAEQLSIIPSKFKNKIVLAEKVETYEIFELAKKSGYKLFQGFFFSKPHIIKEKDIPINSFVNTKILKEINRKNVDLKRISSLISVDLSLTYKLLKLINSPFYMRNKKVESILQAVTLLGLDEITKWLYITSLSKYKIDGGSDIIKFSLQRAKFCESFYDMLDNNYKKSEFFLTGMLSLINVILETTYESALKDLYMPTNVKDALIKKSNDLYSVLDIFLLYEDGNWETIMNDYSSKIDLSNLQAIYFESINWAEELMSII